MQHKKTLITITLATTLVLLVFVPTLVMGSPVDDFFRALNDINLIENYERNNIVIDFIIYLLIFGSVLNATVSKKFGRGASLGIALALSIAMVAFSQQQGFTIGDFWYIAVLVLASTIIGLIYSHVPKNQSGEYNKVYIAIGYITFYIILTRTLNEYSPFFLQENAWLHQILQIFAVCAAIYLAIKFISKLEHKKASS